MPGKERDFRGIIGGILFTFFLDKKSNKKVKAIRCGTFFKAQLFLSRIAGLEHSFGCRFLVLKLRFVLCEVS
jgi:hypothetical protein